MANPLPRNIPAGYELVFSDNPNKIEVWALKVAADQYLAKCFVGRAGKPRWFYKLNMAQMEKQISQTVEGQAAWNKMQAEHKAQRAQPTNVEVGDVFKCSWGYEQTNIDYFQVTKVISPNMIEVREIAASKTETQWLAGQCVPVPGSFIGEPMRKKVTGYNGEPSIKIHSFASAYRIKPIDNVAGVPVYQASYWSAYA